MTKSELVKAISEKSGSTIKDTDKVLNLIIETITETLAKGDDVALVGFGTLSIADRSARNGRDFKTGKIVTIPATKSIKFKAGKALKESVK